MVVRLLMPLMLRCAQTRNNPAWARQTDGEPMSQQLSISVEAGSHSLDHACYYSNIVARRDLNIVMPTEPAGVSIPKHNIGQTMDHDQPVKNPIVILTGPKTTNT